MDRLYIKDKTVDGEIRAALQAGESYLPRLQRMREASDRIKEVERRCAGIELEKWVVEKEGGGESL